MERAEAIIALELNDKYSMEELKTAFRNQANKWHPDHNLSNREFAENKMKQINSAYEMLKNEFLATSGYIGLNKDYDKFAYKINTLFWHTLEYKDENDSSLYEIYKWAYQQYCYIKYEALSKTYLSDYDLEYELVIAKISNVYENTCIKMKNYLYSIIPNNYRTIKIIDRLQETESSSKNIVDYNVGTLYNLYSECEKDIKKELIVSMEKEEKEKLLNKYFALIEEKCINYRRFALYSDISYKVDDIVSKYKKIMIDCIEKAKYPFSGSLHEMLNRLMVGLDKRLNEVFIKYEKFLKDKKNKILALEKYKRGKYSSNQDVLRLISFSYETLMDETDEDSFNRKYMILISKIDAIVMQMKQQSENINVKGIVEPLSWEVLNKNNKK